MTVSRFLALVMIGAGVAAAAQAQKPTAPTPAPAPSVEGRDGSAPTMRAAPGTRFRDCRDCPEMIVVPAGSFVMGTPPSEKDRLPDEGPQQRVAVRAFALGITPVTFAAWDACVAAGTCRRPNDMGWGRGTRPVMNVSWEEAAAYVSWLSQRSGATYRLPTEAEWEYAARAGTTTARWWGEEIGRGNASCNGCGSQWDNRMTAPVGSFRANAFGLHDMLGNVRQWVEDCWTGTLAGRPGDQSAVLTRTCTARVVRGGAWASDPRLVRSGHRAWLDFRNVDYQLGFRVARTLAP